MRSTYFVLLAHVVGDRITSYTFDFQDFEQFSPLIQQKFKRFSTFVSVMREVRILSRYSQWYDDRATTTDRPKFKH